ncbi:hypothetical protein ACFY2Q_07110 [Micromonospora sp. NPDC000316]|uniref:hypothetical protein n=1 Tax=Micromonospora sp. NPDC000316 TaxID=3364216 RepID=UPI0036A74080
MTDEELLDRLGPLDLGRPRPEINARFVGVRAELSGIAEPVPPTAKAHLVTRPAAVTDLDRL